MEKRIIKFRAWAGETMLEWENLKSLRYAIENENITVMQFTGQLDKNGKEVYDGDVLDDGSFVVWRNDLSSFAIRKSNWMYDHYFGEGVIAGQYEVIGNIYQNPELLTTNP